MTRKPVLSQEAPQPSGGYSQGDRRRRLPLPRRPGPVRRRRRARRRDDRRAGAAGAARTSTRSRAPPVARCRTPFACGMYISDMAHFDEMDAEYRHVLLRPEAGAHDDPVRPGRLRRRGRRGRLARRLTRAARVARHAGRHGRSRRGRAEHRADAGLLRRARARVPAAHQDPQAAGDRAHAAAGGRRRDHLPEARRGGGDGGRRAERHPAHASRSSAPPRRSGSRRSPARRTSRSSATRRRWRRGSPPALAACRTSRSASSSRCDTGFARTGVQTPEAAAELAELVDSLPGLRFDGLMTYPTLPETGPWLRAARSRRSSARGLRCARVSAGGTPTFCAQPRRCRRSPRCAPARTSTATARASRTAASRSRTAPCGSARRSSAGRRPSAPSWTPARRR